MRVIKITEEVWQKIASHGKFGETEDDVLRRILGVPATSEINSTRTTVAPSAAPTSRASSGRRRSFATQRMTSYINRNQLHIEFQDGASSSWSLPDPKDKASIRAVLEKALSFAREHEASVGQVNAVRKTLTNEGYHLTK
jgi:hypothetical protein